MAWKNSYVRYGSLSVALHWLMVLMILLVYLCMELRTDFPKGSATREFLKNMHFSLGISILFLTIIRLIFRFTAPLPRIEPKPAAWQHIAGRLSHLALYVFMLGMPIAGWLILSASNKVIPFYIFKFPSLIGKNLDLAQQIKEIHELVGEIGYYLIGFHAGAALFHHYFLRDNTLLRMLPKSLSK